MKSILQKDETRCFLCGKNGGYWGLDVHHVFGASFKEKSEQYGLLVRLCHDTCHLGGVHKDAALNRKLKAYAQQKAMEYHDLTKEEFIKLFGKNYL